MSPNRTPGSWHFSENRKREKQESKQNTLPKKINQSWMTAVSRFFWIAAWYSLILCAGIPVSAATLSASASRRAEALMIPAGTSFSITVVSMPLIFRSSFFPARSGVLNIFSARVFSGRCRPGQHAAGPCRATYPVRLLRTSIGWVQNDSGLVIPAATYFFRLTAGIPISLSTCP